MMWSIIRYETIISEITRSRQLPTSVPPLTILVMGRQLLNFSPYEIELVIVTVAVSLSIPILLFQFIFLYAYPHSFLLFFGFPVVV